MQHPTDMNDPTRRPRSSSRRRGRPEWQRPSGRSGSAHWTCVGLGALVACLGACGPSASRGFEDPNGPVVWTPGVWTQVWGDEFDGDANTPPDPTRWNHEIGGDGWGNKELQSYTDSLDNAALDGAGSLVITARAEPTMGNAYSSARLTTKGIFAHAYGRFEARMRLAQGRGIWPAFWLMGEDIDTAGWPGAGEIDVMEELGQDVNTVFGTVHGPAYGNIDIPTGHATSVPSGVNEGFHSYAIEWDPASIVFLIDDVPNFQVTPQRRPSYARWVFDHPFFIMLNLAVGGLYPGNPDATTTFPQSIAIDYVRVSTRSP
jgi:beta-glucanase (GH16 family)